MLQESVKEPLKETKCFCPCSLVWQNVFNENVLPRQLLCGCFESGIGRLLADLDVTVGM